MNPKDLRNEVPSAYLTSVLLGQYDKVCHIAKELDALYLINKDSGLFKVISDNANVKVIALIGDIERIELFFHPIVHNKVAYIDCRPFMNKEGTIKNTFEYMLLSKRAQLDLVYAYHKEVFSTIQSFVIDAFSSWFSWGVQRNLNIDLRTANYYKMAAAVYYLGLMNTNHHLSEEEIRVYLINTLKRSLTLPVSFIEEIIVPDDSTRLLWLFKRDQDRMVETKLNDLIEILNSFTNEEVLINKAIIYNALCRGAFIAANSAEIASVSLEHPSTFVNMLASVTGKGLQGNTNLGKIVLGVSRHHDMHAFTKFLTAHNVPG